MSKQRSRHVKSSSSSTTTTKPVRRKPRFTTSNQKWSNISMMLYGNPGTGKTHLAGTANLVKPMQKVMFVDNDGGTRTLMGNPKFKDIQIVQMFEWNQYQAFIDWLLGLTPKSPTETREYTNFFGDPAQYKTIVIDNLGALHRMIISHILKHETFQRFHKDIPAQQDYRLAIAWITRVFELLKEYSFLNDINIIFTAHVDHKQNDQGVIVETHPSIPGKLSSIIPGDLPLVGYTSTEGKRVGGGTKAKMEVSYRVAFTPFDRKTIVKDQTPGQRIGILTNPSMVDVYKRLHQIK